MIETVLPPLPIPDTDSSSFWEACREGRLRFQQCSACAAFRFPPLPSCPICASFETQWVEVAGLGTIYSFTVARHSVHPAFPAPYVLALVDLNGAPGVRLSTRIVGCDPADVKIGAQVEVAFTAVTEQITLPLFRLVN